MEAASNLVQEPAHHDPYYGFCERHAMNPGHLVNLTNASTGASCRGLEERERRGQQGGQPSARSTLPFAPTKGRVKGVRGKSTKRSRIHHHLTRAAHTPAIPRPRRPQLLRRRPPLLPKLGRRRIVGPMGAREHNLGLSPGPLRCPWSVREPREQHDDELHVVDPHLERRWERHLPLDLVDERRLYVTTLRHTTLCDRSNDAAVEHAERNCPRARFNTTF